ncbi:hypothetical protein AB0C96_09085 [Streptomyces sp. NPDC048506]|uniref:hypothetical protein n=1 Tax=Streptomyces sp. NPDC048506 TaxID=3155028 RepID=UPI003449339C
MSELETLRAAIRDELDGLWNDLDTARRGALNGQWSMQCDFLVDRIKNLTALVGPTPWHSIELPLLEDGIYQRVHTELGMDAPVDMEHVARTRERIDADRQRGARSTH